MSGWIENVSLRAIETGQHRISDNCMLIQIVDPDMKFPVPFHKFVSTHQFKFLDLEQNSVCINDQWKITTKEAEQLVGCLQIANDCDMDVIVHCVAGVCRSGAVCEVGTMMGMSDTFSHRIPNILVKSLMMKVLKMSYFDE